MTKTRKLTLDLKGITPEKAQEIKTSFIGEIWWMARTCSKLKQNKFNLKKTFYNLTWDKETAYISENFWEKYLGKITPSGKQITEDMIIKYRNNKVKITESQIMKLKLCKGYCFDVFDE